jgi:hypothetical protein
MKRTILSVLAGIAVGAVSASYLNPHAPVREALSPEDASSARQVSDLLPAADRAQAIETVVEGGRAERSTIYRIAVQSDDEDLRALIEELARAPATSMQRFALSVLFTRYAELNVGAAIDALAVVREPRLAEALALVILEVIGIDDLNITRVLAALPSTDPMAFRVEAIAELAKAAPSDALQMALMTDGRAYRSQAVRRMAESWARQDPSAVLAAAARIQDDGLRNIMRNVATSAWARVEPEALLTYLVGITDRNELNALLSSGALRELATSSPGRVLEIADDLPDPFAARVMTIAVASWAQNDPLAAYAYAESLPLGQQRAQLLQRIATAYAREDPDGALVWIDSLDTPRRELTDAVLQGIAQDDPERALRLVLNDGSTRGQPWVIANMVMRISYSNPERMPQIADTLLALEADPRMLDQALGMMASTWARRDAAAALEWTLSNADALPGRTLRDVASNLARDDPAMAARYTNLVPPDSRDTWIAAVAAGYAAYDRQGALDWVGQYRGQAAYAPAVIAVVEATAREDPVAAARLLDSIGTLPEGSNSAVGSVVASWALRDAFAARNYTLNLPQGEARDAALAALVVADGDMQLPDAELMAAFSTELARQQAIARVISSVARSDPIEARRLVDEHLSYPDVRQQAERMIENISR